MKILVIQIHKDKEENQKLKWKQQLNTYIETMMNASKTMKSYSKHKSKQNKNEKNNTS